jgi:alkanesulfonate monooxygenase SsuD/methylene tetrahydromethanopterin reductase-like flavin-dependent oxidoreductase (luciferase family)
MKFGFLSLFNHYPEDCSEKEHYKHFLEDLSFAEALGFDTVWIGEHHMNHYICRGNPGASPTHVGSPLRALSALCGRAPVQPHTI